jgi:hypothetical protein
MIPGLLAGAAEVAPGVLHDRGQTASWQMLHLSVSDRIGSWL